MQKISKLVKSVGQAVAKGAVNSSSFALKVGDAYVACNEDATAAAATIENKKIVDGAAETLYADPTLDNVYLVHGTGAGVTLTFEVDASAISGGQEVKLVSPDAGLGRGVRVLALKTEVVPAE